MISGIIAAAGAAVAVVRTSSLAQRAARAYSPLKMDVYPRVSVIVPARNEENNIQPLLHSLTKMDYPALEVIVVDDQSTDRTGAIASSFSPLVKVLRGTTRPDGWGGKQWACQQGAQSSTGDILLFTDADTVHHSDSIKKALAFMQHRQVDMISVAPKHDGRTFWETLTGFFQIMLMFAANAFGNQTPGRAYCIGQYIMIRKSAYDRLGGHARVREKIVEDVPMANAALIEGLRYDILLTETLYRVRMYESLSDFIRGWRRNFRAGLKDSSPLATVEVTAVIGALIFGGSLLPGPTELLGFVVCVAAMFTLVRRYTNYGLISLAGIPFSVALFCLITGLAVYDSVMGRDVLWKGRSIAVK